MRFIGNYSSGKMGFALARACADAGADVVLISGPVQQQIDHRRVKRIDVESAEQMYEAAMHYFPQCDGAVLCAAVADFTPVAVASEKIKRKGDNLLIELHPTRDIAAALGSQKRTDQFLVGFALETHDEEAHAREKMQRKNFDFIVLNSLADDKAGFGYDTNKITILKASGEKQAFPLKPKTEVAADIVAELERL